MRLALAALLLPALAACGSTRAASPSADPSSAPTSSTPETESVNIVLTDSLPLTVLFNGSHGQCATNLLGMGSPVQIVIKNASGTTVSASTLPTAGGTFYQGSCSWPLSITAPYSKFYSVTAMAGQHSASTTAPVGEIANVSFD